MRQFRLSTIFVAMAVIGVNLAIAKWEIEYGIVSTAMTIGVGTILVSRRFNRSRLASAFLCLATATVGAALVSSMVSSFLAFSAPPNGGIWMYGGGFPMIIASGILGGFVGLVFGGIPVAVSYGLCFWCKYGQSPFLRGLLRTGAVEKYGTRITGPRPAANERLCQKASGVGARVQVND
jgi:hypothetical protein